MRTSLILLLSALFCSPVQAQGLITFGQSYTLKSEVLGEQRTLNVLLPTEYADSAAKNYPVVYLLDGATDEDFFHAAGLLRYLDDHDMMPPAILVGIANVDRKRLMSSCTVTGCFHFVIRAGFSVLTNQRNKFWRQVFQREAIRKVA